MKRKIIIIYLLSNILLFCGCEINNLNSTRTPSKLTVSDIKQLVGVTYGDVEKIYGSPEKSTYYINIDNLPSINKNYISLRDFSYNSIIKASYDINNNDSYIVLWYKDNKVIESSFDETDLINEDYSDINISNIDIKIDYSKNSSNLNNNLLEEKYTDYIGNNIKEFNNKYNLICPKISVNLSSKNKIFYFYDIKYEDENYLDNNSLFIICNNNIITDIRIIKYSKICETIVDSVK